MVCLFIYNEQNIPDGATEQCEPKSGRNRYYVAYNVRLYFVCYTASCRCNIVISWTLVYFVPQTQLALPYTACGVD